MSGGGIFHELMRRGVAQAVAIWVAITWGATEILITATERFGWPAWIADAALILFLTGLPFVVLVAWFFDLSGDGLHRTDPSSIAGKLTIASIATIVIGSTAAMLVLRDDGPITIEGETVIAVLPFQDFSGEDGGALTALAYTGELIHRVSAHPDLLALDLRTVTNPAVASMLATGDLAQLRPDYVVQGEIRAARGGVEVAVRMADAAGGVLWDEAYLVDADGGIAARDAQALIAGNIAASLGTVLTGVDYCEPSADAAAVRSYYRGWSAFGSRGAEGVARAARALEDAVARDPDYARALAELAVVYQRFDFWLSEDPSPYLSDRAEFEDLMDGMPARLDDLTRRALDRCPNLGNAYLTREFGRAEGSIAAREVLDEALRRSPDDITLLNMVTNVHRVAGHTGEAVGTARRAQRKDPLNPRTPHLLGGVVGAQGDTETAIALELEAKALGYAPSVADLFLALLLVEAEDVERLDAHWLTICAAHRDLYCDASGAHLPHRLMPLDPRTVLAARSGDPVASETVRSQVAELTATLGERDRARLIRWVRLTRDLELVWSVLDAAEGMQDDYLHVLWSPEVRGRSDGDRILAFLERIGSDLPEYWGVYGAPDGCVQDGESLSCSPASP